MVKVALIILPTRNGSSLHCTALFVYGGKKLIPVLPYLEKNSHPLSLTAPSLSVVDSLRENYSQVIIWSIRQKTITKRNFRNPRWKCVNGSKDNSSSMKESFLDWYGKFTLIRFIICLINQLLASLKKEFHPKYG